MAIKELVTRFGFEIDHKGLEELNEGIEAVKEGLLHLGEALIGEAVGLYELVHHAAEAGVKLHIMSEETGIASDRLQELQLRAQLAEVGADELTQSMNLLARNMISAKQGSEEARRAFRQVGISTAELRSGTLSTDQALSKIAGRFQKLQNGPQKTALAMELFGRAGARMIPFLMDLNEELSPVNQKILEMSRITEDQIEASREFDDELKLLKTALLGITRVVGFGLMPAATEVIEAMKQWVVKNREVIKTNLIDFAEGMTAALRVTIKVVDVLVEAFAGLAHGIGGVKFATELLLGGFALLSGLTVLFGIGKVTQAVVELGNAFAITNLKAAAIPVAIGAAMIAIFLIMEDIYSFFVGKKSFTGDLLEKLPEVGRLFKSVFEPIFEPLVALITGITDGTITWKKAFQDLGEIIINSLLLPLRLILSTIATVTTWIGRLSGSQGIKDFADRLQGLADNATAGGIAKAAGIGPEAAVASAPASNSNTRQTNNELNVKNEFNFPPGTDPAVVGDKISSSVSSGLDDVLRSTQRVNSSGGAR